MLLCLILFSTLGLCACAGKGGEAGREKDRLAKEHVYGFQELEMPDFGGGETEVCGTHSGDGRIFLLIKVTDRTDYNENDRRILSFSEDGSGVALTTLETASWNPGAEGYSYYEGETFGADGRIYALRNRIYRDGQSPEEKRVRYLCCWAAEGSLLWERELEALSANAVERGSEGFSGEDGEGEQETFPADVEELAVRALAVTAEGEISLILTGQRAWKISADARGRVSGSGLLSEETLETFDGSEAILHRRDGKLLLVCYGEENWEERHLTVYDPVRDRQEETWVMPVAPGWDGYGAIAVAEGGLLYSSLTGICFCGPEEPEGEERMNFVNSDMNVRNYDFDALVSLGDKSFAGMFREGDGRERLGIFTWRDPADLPDRTVLVLSGMEIDDRVLQRVVEFNRSNDRYRIVVKNTVEYDTDEALAAGVAGMTSDIFSGDMPDLLAAEGLPVEIYAARGLLADIGEYLEKDEELSKTEFLQNVFDAYVIKGKLYYVIPSFEAGTMIGAASVVGNGTSWNFGEAKALLETLPEGTALMAEASRETFLEAVMTYCGGFIDLRTGECDFQTQEFYDMLEYAKTLPEKWNSESLGEDYWRNYDVQFREGRTLLASMRLCSFQDARGYVNGLFGEEATCIGFPSEGGGAYVRAGEIYAISARSDHPEGAWEFLRYYLTKEYQSGLKTGLPVRKECFLESARQALRESRPSGEEGAFAFRETMTEEQMDRLMNFILSVDRRCFDNEEIAKIVYEEAGAFFAGDRSAEESARIMQSRVELYLETNMD